MGAPLVTRTMMSLHVDRRTSRGLASRPATTLSPARVHVRRRRADGTIDHGAVGGVRGGGARAGRVRRGAAASGTADLATVRQDGVPRVHPVTPIIGAGGLYLFMEPTSPRGATSESVARSHCTTGCPTERAPAASSGLPVGQQASTTGNEIRRRRRVELRARRQVHSVRVGGASRPAATRTATSPSPRRRVGARRRGDHRSSRATRKSGARGRPFMSASSMRSNENAPPAWLTTASLASTSPGPATSAIRDACSRSARTRRGRVRSPGPCGRLHATSSAPSLLIVSRGRALRARRPSRP